MPQKYVSLGLAGILECSEHSSFFKDLQAQTSEVGSFYSLSGLCRWDLLSGCVLWHHIQLRNVQRRLQLQGPGSEVHVLTVLSVAGTGQFHC